MGIGHGDGAGRGGRVYGFFVCVVLWVLTGLFAWLAFAVLQKWAGS